MRLFALLLIYSTSAFSASIVGTWELTKFVMVDSGYEKDWCEGARGAISYNTHGKMRVEIHCQRFEPGSNAEELGGYLYYSGPYNYDGKIVTHFVKNYSHPSLNKVYKRLVETSGNKLRLIGELGPGKQVVVEWIKI